MERVVLIKRELTVQNKIVKTKLLICIIKITINVFNQVKKSVVIYFQIDQNVINILYQI